MRQLLFTYLLLLACCVHAQDYNYVHYDTKDGLAASNVYDMCQDKDGYLWFATEFGVSRFDGKVFKTFTTADGLTDNEVLKIYTDSYGKVWMVPFNGTVCYYKLPLIYNNTNDSLLRQISTNRNLILNVTSLNNGKAAFYNGSELSIYNTAEHKIICFTNLELCRKYRLSGKIDGVLLVEADNKDKLIIGMNDTVYMADLISTDVRPLSGSWRSWRNEAVPRYIFDNNAGHGKVFAFRERPSGKVISFFIEGKDPEAYAFCATTNGAYGINADGYFNRHSFLPGKAITRVIKDTEGNLWFSTLGHGVYKLTTQSMQTYQGGKDVLSIERCRVDLLAGLGNGDLARIDQTGRQQVYPFMKRPDLPIGQRLYCMKQHPSGVVFLGYDCYLAKYQQGRFSYSAINPVKSIAVVDEQHIAVSTNQYTFKLRVSDMRVVDTIFRERATKVIFQQGSYYFGTLNGLVQLDKNRQLNRLGTNISLCRERVTDIVQEPDGTLWIATGKDGVFRYAGNAVTALVNTTSGLSSNICRSLFYHNGFLWVGTNKGLNKIRLTDNKVLAHYSVSDGLPADIINAIYANDTMVWVGTPAGLTHFREADMSASSVCNLVMEAVKVSGKPTDSAGSTRLHWRQNNISFEYTAISFKSAGDIVYKYRLKGLDDEWRETRLTTLSYPSLPSGDYELELYAINKFGKKSNTLTYTFAIAAPFWATAWFRTLLVLCGLAIFWLLLNRRFKALQQRTAEKNNVRRRMAELEQTALRAQMNPHFIFNCLSSIQHFALQNDIEKTNEYITRFGSLIRQTMDNSAKTNITVAGEVKYLETYMRLEQMRFPEKFNWHIYVEPGIQTDYVFIPSMILQPFVENAIRHGIRYKETGEGLVTIHITRQEGYLVCCVQDNGVGRVKAKEYQGNNLIEYQSKGITLSVNRLEMLGGGSTQKVETDIMDLHDPNGHPCGTKVCIRFPQEIIDKLY